MRCALAKQVFIVCITVASSWSVAIVVTPENKNTAIQLKLVPQGEPARAQVASLETPLSGNRVQTVQANAEPPVTQESGEISYGAVIAAFILMGAIAIRRHLSGRS